ncbi:MAG TPA: Pycsar system effector family protein [Sphingobacteriaceae bacterium]|nr:Pycsar system effector family protein [Sphingobacteriaceae bacterium]
MKNSNPVVKEASEFIFNLFKEKLSSDHLYHNYKHTTETVKYCKELGEKYNLTTRDYEVLALAAWFHDTGYTQAYAGHEEKSIEILKEFLRGEYPLEDQKEIETLILSTRWNAAPDGTLQEILHDADYINIGKKNFDNRAQLLRIEWERLLKKDYSEVEWAEAQLNFLISKNFKTEEATINYNDQREENIRNQRLKIEVLKNEKLKLDSKVNSNNEKLKKEGRGIETLYRSIYQYHVDLSGIADNKANIMISINTIIISLIITLFGSGYTFSSGGELSSIRFVFPIALLLITSLSAVVFAILSARPNVTTKEKFELKQKKGSAIFFGNFAQLDLTEFVNHIKRLKDEKDELYDSMSVDIYYLGSVLVKKYKLLTWSYNLFMGGLVICAVGFIAIMLFSSYGA